MKATDAKSNIKSTSHFGATNSKSSLIKKLFLIVGRAFPRKGRSFSLFIVTLSTIAYLLIEFSFNARLLDAVGTITSESSISEIEKWGRMISGFALALVLWPSILDKLSGASGKIVALAFITAVVVMCVYVAEKILLDTLVERSSAKERYTATNLILLQNALISSNVKIDGLDMSRQDMSEPDGKAFVATLPLILFSVNNIDSKVEKKKKEIIENVVDTQYGGLAENFNRYVDSLSRLRSSYNSEYLNASEAYNDALKRIPVQQEIAWSRYQATLRERRWTPESVPSYHYERVRKQVQKSGVPVTQSWVPGDKLGFYQAVSKKIEDSSIAAYRTSIVAEIGNYIPPGLSPEQFIYSKPIQEKWRKTLRYPDNITLQPGYRNIESFNKEVYKKVIDITASSRLSKITGAIPAYGDNGALENIGKDNMRLLLAPSMALAFSVAGAVVHVFKVLFYLIQVVTGRAWVNGMVKTTVIAALSGVMFWAFSVSLQSKITSQVIYRDYLHESVIKMFGNEDALQGRLMANAIRGTINIQPMVYPIFEKIRINFMLGYSFGYQITKK